MRTASRQRSPGRLVAFFSGLAALIFARACLIEIEKPLEPDAGVGGSVSAGGSAGSGAAGSGATGGSTSGTSGNDAGDAPSCPGGQKPCDGKCVSRNDPAFGCESTSCDRCTTNAQATCSDAGTCVITCDDGFVDCNNQASDGCEVRFGPAPTDLPTIMVSSDAGTDTFHQIAGPHDITVDQDRSDWVEAIPLVRVNRACVGCQVNNSPGGNLGVLVENPNTPPNSRDLEAYFRVTWNADSLFLLALVKDDQPLVTGPDPMITNYNPSPAELQDGVEVLVDGDFVLVNGYRSDTDRHLFIGAASDVYNANQKADERNNPDITIGRTQAGSCYFVEMQIKSPYVRSTSLPPLGAGVRLGFDVAINDWDAERREADRNVPVRAHQAFWREPGPLYAHDSTNFPKVELFTP